MLNQSSVKALLTKMLIVSSKGTLVKSAVTCERGRPSLRTQTYFRLSLRRKYVCVRRLTQSTLKYFRHQHGDVGRREFPCKKAQASCIWRYRANGKRSSEASVKERTSCHSCSENTGETEYSVSYLLAFDHINQAKS